MSIPTSPLLTPPSSPPHLHPVEYSTAPSFLSSQPLFFFSFSQSFFFCLSYWITFCLLQPSLVVYMFVFKTGRKCLRLKLEVICWGICSHTEDCRSKFLCRYVAFQTMKSFEINWKEIKTVSLNFQYVFLFLLMHARTRYHSHLVLSRIDQLTLIILYVWWNTITHSASSV